MARSILQAIFWGLENMFYSFSPRFCFLLLIGNPNTSIKLLVQIPYGLNLDTSYANF